MPARAPASMDMLQTVMRSSMDIRADGGSGVLDGVAHAPARPDRRDRSRGSRPWPSPPNGRGPTTVMRMNPAACAARGTGWPARARPRWEPHPEGERAEGSVGRGVRVAAHEQDAGLGHALLGTDHVHDALARLATAEESNSSCTVNCKGNPSASSWTSAFLVCQAAAYSNKLI